MKDCVALIVFLFSSATMFAEPVDFHRFEVGPLVGLMSYEALTFNNMSPRLGGRITVNLNRTLALEYQMAWGEAAPQRNSSSSVQGTGHVKLNLWRKKSAILNIFAIAGPGFMIEEYQYFSRYLYTDRYRSVAFDYGGGLEIIPRSRFLVRIDFTDFYAGTRLHEYLIDTTSYPPFNPQRFWSHHLDAKAAVMFRF